MQGTLATHEIDKVEAALVANFPRAEFPVENHFVPGLYRRTTTLPAGTAMVSMEHKTEHFFVILSGEVRVSSGNEGSVTYIGPCMGVTKPGTRRILHAVTETIWATFHVTEETDVAKIAEQILEPHVNPLIPEKSKNQWKGGPCLG